MWWKKDPSEWRKINGKWHHFNGFTLNGKDLSMKQIHALSLLFTYGDDSLITDELTDQEGER